MFLFAGWEQGFSQGALQATNRILAEQEQTEEVVRLRAQLDAQGRWEDRSSNVLLAAFAAGATVLVVVNFASYFIAQQRLQEERRGLQQDLIRDAEDRDRTMDQELRAYTDQRVARVEDRQAVADARIDQIATQAASGSHLARVASASILQTLGQEREAVGDHFGAAIFFARAARYDAEADKKLATGTFLISRVVDNLDRADWNTIDSDSSLDSLVSLLQKVDAAPPPDVEVSDLVKQAVSRLETLRAERDAHGE